MSVNFQPYHRRKLANNVVEINNRIYKKFLKHSQEKNIKRTHYFNDRYENIYLNDYHIPELKLLMQQANEFASIILGTNNLKSGYWFNSMPPSSITTLHTHDDDDELLSCVYYVNVPKNSGNLIIHHNNTQFKIQPEAGEFIFFKPDVPHEVNKNKSTEHRLSIGINFGKARS